jgi:hypothetical protein
VTKFRIIGANRIHGNLSPSLGAARFDAQGELRLAERLKDCLEDNAWVWHDIPVGPLGRHPDFMTLHPNQGIR